MSYFYEETRKRSEIIGNILGALDVAKTQVEIINNMLFREKAMKTDRTDIYELEKDIEKADDAVKLIELAVKALNDLKGSEEIREWRKSRNEE